MNDRTRRFSVEAHPLVVAVALGILGPSVLATEEEEEEAVGYSAETAESWPGPAPSADEFHRVELEWLKT